MRINIIIVFFLINLNFILISDLHADTDDIGDNQDSNKLFKQICAEEGGEWKLFPDGCVDNCNKYNQKEQIFCTMALTYSCECGLGRCFNFKLKTCQDHPKNKSAN